MRSGLHRTSTRQNVSDGKRSDLLSWYHVTFRRMRADNRKAHAIALKLDAMKFAITMNILLGCQLLVNAYSAELYKCVANGATTYQEVPCATSGGSTVRVDKSPSDSCIDAGAVRNLNNIASQTKALELIRDVPNANIADLVLKLDAKLVELDNADVPECLASSKKSLRNAIVTLKFLGRGRLLGMSWGESYREYNEHLAAFDRSMRAFKAN